MLRQSRKYGYIVVSYICTHGSQKAFKRRLAALAIATQAWEPAKIKLTPKTALYVSQCGRFIRHTLYVLQPHLTGPEKWGRIEAILGVSIAANKELFVDEIGLDVSLEKVSQRERESLDRFKARLVGLCIERILVQSKGWLKPDTCFPFMLRFYVFQKRTLNSQEKLLHRLRTPSSSRAPTRCGRHIWL